MSPMNWPVKNNFNEKLYYKSGDTIPLHSWITVGESCNE